MTSKLQIDSNNVDFHFHVKVSDICKFEKIIIVDDCIGSGDQLYSFWNSSIAEIKREAKAKGVDMFYMALIGNEKQIIELQLDGSLEGLHVVICDKLEDCNRIYSIENNIWNSNEEMEFAISYFDDVESRCGVPRLGYGGLDFSLFMHNTVPDWTLPLFWTENYDWKALMKRKNSNY